MCSNSLLCQGWHTDAANSSWQRGLAKSSWRLTHTVASNIQHQHLITYLAIAASGHATSKDTELCCLGWRHLNLRRRHHKAGSIRATNARRRRCDAQGRTKSVGRRIDGLLAGAYVARRTQEHGGIRRQSTGGSTSTAFSAARRRTGLLRVQRCVRSRHRALTMVVVSLTSTARWQMGPMMLPGSLSVLRQSTVYTQPGAAAPTLHAGRVQVGNSVVGCARM